MRVYVLTFWSGKENDHPDVIDAYLSLDGAEGAQKNHMRKNGLLPSESVRYTIYDRMLLT